MTSLPFLMLVKGKGEGKSKKNKLLGSTGFGSDIRLSIPVLRSAKAGFGLGVPEDRPKTKCGFLGRVSKDKHRLKPALRSLQLK